MNNKELTGVLNLIIANMGNQETIGQKKLFKIYEKLKVHLDLYKEQIDDIRIEFASVDEKGHLLKDEKGEYLFSKENMKLMVKAMRDIENKEIQHQPISIVNPKGLEPFYFLDKWVVGVDFEDVVI
jgi:DUF438 domain-containing protein